MKLAARIVPPLAAALVACASHAPSDAGAGALACSPPCPATLACVAGACGPISCPGGDCPAGLSCIAGYCATNDCAPPCTAAQSCVDGLCLARPATACTASYALCDAGGGAFCADVASDPRNCGGCGAACGAGLACVAAQCAPVACGDGGSCPAGLSCLASGFCGSGDCSVACPGGQVCVHGGCFAEPGGVSCPSPFSPCRSAAGAYCADLQEDALDCGACGAACDAGSACFAGVCTACPPGQTPCPGGCADLSGDPNNCGSCGNGCGAGSCVNGSCQCSGGPAASCAGSCVNLGSDCKNCGACGATCGANQVCIGGAPYTCPAGTVACPGNQGCHVLAVDPYDCGSCGHSCWSGIATAVCQDGGCAFPGLAANPALEWNVGCTVAADGTIYVASGLEAPACCVQVNVQAYAPAKNAWTVLAPLPVPCAGNDSMAGLAAVPGTILAQYPVAGPSGGAVGGLFALDEQTNLWSPRQGPPVAVTDAPLVWDGHGSVYLPGGGIVTDSYTNELLRYDLAGRSWTILDAGMPTARQDLAAAFAGGKLYALGGWNGVQAFSAVEAYDPDAGAWTSLPPLPTARAYLGAAIGADGLLYAVGGTADGQTPLGTVEALDLDAGTWITGLPPMPTPRWGLGLAPGLDGRLYAIGGRAGGSTILGNVEAYDPVGRSWSR